MSNEKHWLFPKGNKVSEKWTEDAALEFIAKVLKAVDKDKKNYHLGKALIDCDGYPDLWAYLGDKFKNSEKVFRAIKEVEQKLEARIINSSLNGDIKSAAMAIFYLKNKHGYKDRTETDLTTKGETINRTIELPEGQSLKDLQDEIQEGLNEVH